MLLLFYSHDIENTTVVAFTINMLNTCSIYLVLLFKKMGKILFAIATIFQRKGGEIFDNS